jgi:hypothetical protein
VLDLGTGQAADLAVPLDRDELIAYGPLLSDNGATRLGTAALVSEGGPGHGTRHPGPGPTPTLGAQLAVRQAVVVTEDIQAGVTAETLRIAQHPRASARTHGCIGLTHTDGPAGSR